MFDSSPKVTIQTETYSSIMKLHQHDFTEMLRQFTFMKKIIQTKIINDPFDEDRDNFIRVCRRNIPYLSNLDKKILKKLYYRCNEYYYEMDE
jgi:hypothetical protein